MRKMLSVQSVSEINPIINAEAIELLSINGWNVVVRKDQFAVGQKVAYFEIDSFLPASDPRFKTFQSRGQNSLIHEDGSESLGHVVRTAKLRGIYSEGIVMGLDELGYTNSQVEELSIGDNISKMNGIVKWEEPIPDDKNIIGQFDSRWMPKTGSNRVQNLSAHWNEIVSLDWEASLKVDGSSHTIINDGNSVKIMGHNWELDPSMSEGYEVAVKWGLVAEVEKYPTMAIQFELVGPGLHKNRLKLSEKRPFAFSVWLNGVKLPRSEWSENALKASVPILPIKLEGSMKEMIKKISELRGSVTKDVADEGVVFHITSKDTPMWMNRNASVKIVSPKYLTKHKL